MNASNKARSPRAAQHYKRGSDSGTFLRVPQPNQPEQPMAKLLKEQPISSSGRAAETAQFLVEAREWLRRDLTEMEVQEIVRMMKTSEFSEVPLLLWSLLTKHPTNLFRLHPLVQDFLVQLTDSPKSELQHYLDTHLNTVDAKRFPVHAILIEWNVIQFKVERNRFVWP